MTTYRIIYKNNFARQIITIEARNLNNLNEKLESRCIYKDQVVSIKEGF